MAKKLPSKPKAPKAKASLATWENYERKVAEWKRKNASLKRFVVVKFRPQPIADVSQL